MSLPTQYNNKNQAPVGALSSALARLQSSKPLRELREVAKGVTKQMPEPIQEATAKIDEYARGMISGTGSTLFEELGLYYIGPVDGHSMTGACSGLAREAYAAMPVGTPGSVGAPGIRALRAVIAELACVLMTATTMAARRRRYQIQVICA